MDDSERFTEENHQRINRLRISRQKLVKNRRVSLGEPIETWIQKAFAGAPTLEAPLTHDIAHAANAIDLPHRDPADRFLAATAKVLGLTLVTAGEKLLRARGFAVPGNRRSTS